MGMAPSQSLLGYITIPKWNIAQVIPGSLFKPITYWGWCNLNIDGFITLEDQVFPRPMAIVNHVYYNWSVYNHPLVI